MKTDNNKTPYVHKYKMKYDLKPEFGTFTASEVEDAKASATDALLCFSLLYPEDGSFSSYMFSVDGRNNGKPLDDDEVFKVWTLMAKRMADSRTLPPGKREFARQVFETYRAALLNS